MEQKKNVSFDDVKDKTKQAIADYAQDKFGKGKGNRNGKFKSKRRGKGRGPLMSRGTRFNDVSYYTKNKSITEAFCNLPFSWIVANPLVNLSTELTLKIPAIVSYMIDWVSTLGTPMPNVFPPSGDDTDIIDQVATIIYSQMRRSNSGSTNGVEHVDVIISNLIASIDICVNVHYLHRIFKVANTFSWKNRLVPKYIFEHHFGMDYDDFIANQANYRGEFNTVIAMARTIRTLADFPFINAIMDEFNNIFKDSDTDNGREQLILSVKPLHHIYDARGTQSAPGGCVRLMTVGDVYPSMIDYADRLMWTGTPVESRPAKIKFKVYLDILRAQINALITDNDFNLIQADIEKAFGEQSGYIVVDPITDVDTITPIYSGEFNLMFKNGKFCAPGHSDSNNTWEMEVVNAPNGSDMTYLRNNAIVNTIYQTHDEEGGKTKLRAALFWKANFNHTQLSNNEILNILNMEADKPSCDEIVIATRFKHTSRIVLGSDLQAAGVPEEYLSDSAYYHAPCNCSNFICFGGNITYVETTSTTCYIRYTPWNNVSSSVPVLLLALEHPPVFMSSSGQLYDNINNIRGIENSELYPIQKSCFLSLWNLPSRTNL